TAWTGWTNTPSGTDGTAQRTFTNFDFAGNTTGTIKVYVDHYNPSGLTSPRIVALATISIPNSAPITKQVEVTLSKRSYFAMGMVAENTITFGGNNAYVDSWNSERDSSGNLRTPPEAYSNSNKQDNGSIGAASVGAAITV